MFPFNDLIPSLVCIGSGILLGGTQAGQSDGLVRYAFLLCMPAFIFLKISESQIDFTESLLFMGAFLASQILVGAAGIIWAYYRSLSYREQLLTGLAACYTNSAFLGIPILTALGNSIEPALIVLTLQNFLIMPFFVGLLDARISRAKWSARIWKNPIILGAFAGLVVLTFKIPLPENLYNSLKLLGAGGVSTSLVVVGMSLRQVAEREKIFTVDASLSASVVLKNVLHPILAFILATGFGAGGEVLRNVVLMSAMPTAVNHTIVSSFYGGDSEHSARVVVISTVMSIFVIFIVVSVL